MLILGGLKLFAYCSLLITVNAVILLNHPVKNLFALISTCLLLASIFLTFGVEFISFLICIIYIGAVSILFLFVVMLLNANTRVASIPGTTPTTVALQIAFLSLGYCFLMRTFKKGPFHEHVSSFAGYYE